MAGEGALLSERQIRGWLLASGFVWSEYSGEWVADEVMVARLRADEVVRVAEQGWVPA